MSAPVVRKLLERGAMLGSASPALGPHSHSADIALTIAANKTRQGYACKRILKPAGYFFVPRPAAWLLGPGAAR